MGLTTKEADVVLNSKNIKYYEDLGYNIPRIKGKWGVTVQRGTKIKVKVEDLPEGSHVRVNVKCDNCGKEQEVRWMDFKKVNKNGKYYCIKCAYKLYSIENARKTKLKNGKSFEQWCIENNRQDILDRWDYELNKYKPNEVSYATSIKIYLKCPKLKHESELKYLFILTTMQSELNCNKCNSFAQYGIDNICSDFLEKYWDYEKNIVDPWEIASQYNKKVWIKCQEKDYHGSYSIKPNDFVSYNARCPYCNKNSGKVHPLDSLGKLLEDKNLLYLWSDKNNKSPYEYTPGSNQKVYWKCLEGKHKDYKRSIYSSKMCNFRCPECGFSHGENRISQYFINKNINYEPQKQFENLIGVGGCLLSYDFYLSDYNLLIEYQGEQHEKYIEGFHKSKRDFYIQQEHDRRKREYAKNNNIKFLEIWYWDFDDIEQILDDYLNNFKIKEKVS